MVSLNRHKVVRCTGMSTNLHYTRVFAYVSIFFVEYSLTLPQSISENHFFIKKMVFLPFIFRQIAVLNHPIAIFLPFSVYPLHI